MAASVHNRLTRRWERRHPTIVAAALLGLWVAVLIGPLGFGGQPAHHHEDGQSDGLCLVCTLLYAALTQPDAAGPAAAPVPAGTIRAPAEASTPVTPCRSPAAPRAPPTLALS